MYRKYLLGLSMFVMAFALSGCTENKNFAEYNSQKINASLSGTLGPINEAEEYTLTTTEGPKKLHDGNTSLADYVGQEITVTGQYSGTTLYVDTVEIGLSGATEGSTIPGEGQ